MRILVEKQAGGLRRVTISARRGTGLAPRVFRDLREPADWVAVTEGIAEISRAERLPAAEMFP